MNAPRWTVANSANAGVFGKVFPVLLDSALDPNDVVRHERLPGPFEIILCSNPNTAWHIAAWLNSHADSIAAMIKRINGIEAPACEPIGAGLPPTVPL